jgi:hypothetical protein
MGPGVHRRATVSNAVLSAVPNGTRLGGSDRADTAAVVAQSLSGGRTGAVFVDTFREDGWTFGLLGASLTDVGPLLVAASDSMSGATEQALCRQSGPVTLVGSTASVRGVLLARSAC